MPQLMHVDAPVQYVHPGTQRGQLFDCKKVPLLQTEQVLLPTHVLHLATHALFIDCINKRRQESHNIVLIMLLFIIKIYWIG